MNITIELPEYVSDVLTREAKAKGLDLVGLLREEAIRSADTTMRTWWTHCRERQCAKCGELNDSGSGSWNPKVPTKCCSCGARLTSKNCLDVMADGKKLEPKKRDAWYRDTEAFLKAAHDKRRKSGYSDPVYIPLKEAVQAFFAQAKKTVV